MANAGDVLDMAPLGCRVQLIRTAAETGGELLEFDVLGRPRGFLVQPHVHVGQVERYEVMARTLKVVENGREHLLGPGETMEVPAGTAASPAARRQGRRTATSASRSAPPAARRPSSSASPRCAPRASSTASASREPVAGAQLVTDFGDEGHAARPPLRVQKALSRLVLRVAGLMRPYVFVDEWDVAAPREAVFAAIADARTYPEWWRPVYLDVDADGPAELGKESRQHFKGRLPYHLHTRSRVVALDAPRTVTADVDGDLRGRGTWTLTPTATGTHVRFDWQVHADRRLLRALTPVLRPVFRWNHNWAIARAMEGLEPYARRTA